MMTESNEYEGLTEEEFAELAKSSEIRTGEDATTWAARARAEADAAKKVAADRRAAAAESVENESTVQ